VDLTIVPRNYTESGEVRGEEQTAKLECLVASSYVWTRSPLGQADTLTVTLPTSAVPIDDRLIRFALVSGWLFVHEDFGDPLLVRDGLNELSGRLTECKPGDEGHFAGVLIRPARVTGEQSSELTLEFRDMSELPRRQAITADGVNGCKLDQHLVDIVQYLIRLMPGGEDWAVIGRGKLATTAPDALLTVEKKYRKTVTRRAKVDEAGAEGNVTKDVEASEANIPDASQPAPQQTQFASLEYKKTSVVVTQKVEPEPADIFGENVSTVWDAITAICTIMGCVPEVAVDETGTVTIYVLDAEEAQRGGVFRAFEREFWTHRRLTYPGDVATLETSRDVMGDRKLDWIECFSPDPDTGKIIRGRFGRDGDEDASGADTGAGVYMVAPGVTSEDHLRELAKRAWLSAAVGEMQVTVSTGQPWSTGGSPDEPDLLGAAPGAAIAIEASDKLRGIMRGQTLDDELTQSGIKPKWARVFANASNAIPLSNLFQIASCTHSAAEGGEYDWTALLQCFINDGPSPAALDPFEDL
jgi:Rieske Fe-S protein